MLIHFNLIAELHGLADLTLADVIRGMIARGFMLQRVSESALPGTWSVCFLKPESVEIPEPKT